MTKAQIEKIQKETDRFQNVIKTGIVLTTDNLSLKSRRIVDVKSTGIVLIVCDEIEGYIVLERESFFKAYKNIEKME